MNQVSHSIQVVFQILRKSFDLYKQGYRTFISIGLCFGFLDVLQSLIVTKPSMISIVFMFASSWLSLTVIYATLSLGDPKKERELKEIFLMPRERFVDFILTNLVYLMVIIVGLMILFVPGIYCAIVFVVADIIVVMENKKIPEVFKRSAELVKGNVLVVLLFNCTISMTAIFLLFGLSTGSGEGFHLGRTLSIVLSVFVYPYVTIAKLHLYFSLVENNKMRI